MHNKITLVLVIAILSSGCVSNENSDMNQSIIPKTNLPYGFSYLGMHETEVDIGGISMNTTEGVYRYNGEDIYIQVIKSNNPEALLDQYKLQYKDYNYNPFKEISFNGHKATLITDYMIKEGRQRLYYTLIWAKDNFMIIIGSSKNAEAVINLAIATGY